MVTSMDRSSSPVPSYSPNDQDDSVCLSTTKTSFQKTVRIKPVLSPLDIPDSISASLETKAQRPPRDAGMQAYVVLFAATIVSSFPCGIYLSYGVYQAYYKTSPEYPSSENAAWIGVLSSGLPFLLSPLMVYICTHNTWSRIHYVWVGWLLGVIALVGAAFSPTIPSLIVTQGLLFGLSIVVADNPMLLIVNTWFLSHRGLAYGIIFGACDLLGVAWSFLAEYLLNHLGPQKTFLVFAAILFTAPGPCILLLKERGATSILHRSTLSATPKTSNAQHSRKGSSGLEPCDEGLCSAIAGDFDLIRRDTPLATKKRFWQTPIFYILTASNLFTSLAFYLPLIYLPTYAAHLHQDLSSTANPSDETTTALTTHPSGALALALLNLAQILGELLFGRLSDLVSVHLLAIITTTTASLSTFLLWGYCTSQPLLLSYALIFGFSGAGFLALWARMGMIFGERDAMMVFGSLCAGRGLGAIISGPVSEALLREVGGGDIAGGWASAAGGRYRDLIVFVGAMMALAAGLGVVGFVVDRPEKSPGDDNTGGGMLKRMSSTRGRKKASQVGQAELREEKQGICLETREMTEGLERPSTAELGIPVQATVDTLR